jgi:aldose 1-epimerase
MIPVDRETVEGTAYDFRLPRPIRDTVLDHGYGGLDHADGRVTVTVRDPGSAQGVALWGDERVRWLQVYTGDDTPTPRRALAVEPMTAPADAFRSGEDLVVLAPAGRPGDEHSVSWGISALE